MSGIEFLLILPLHPSETDLVVITGPELGKKEGGGMARRVAECQVRNWAGGLAVAAASRC